MQSMQADETAGDAHQLSWMLRPFPFRTFDEIAALGLEVEIYCPRCYRHAGPIDLSDPRLRGRTFARTRFVCSRMRQVFSATPPAPCGCLGSIVIRPRPADRIPIGQSTPWCSIACPACVPHWEVTQAAPHLLPWSRIWTGGGGVALACPACGSRLTTVWHGGAGVPFTEGYRRDVTPPSSPAAE